MLELFRFQDFLALYVRGTLTICSGLLHRHTVAWFVPFSGLSPNCCISTLTFISRLAHLYCCLNYSVFRTFLQQLYMYTNSCSGLHTYTVAWFVPFSGLSPNLCIRHPQPYLSASSLFLGHALIVRKSVFQPQHVPYSWDTLCLSYHLVFIL